MKIIRDEFPLPPFGESGRRILPDEYYFPSTDWEKITSFELGMQQKEPSLKDNEEVNSGNDNENNGYFG